MRTLLVGSGDRYANPNLYQNGKQLTGLQDAYGPRCGELMPRF